MIKINPVQIYRLRKLNFLKQQNLNLINYFILFLVLNNQVKGQFNINPSSKLKDRLNNFENNQYYANQLQNHRITDHHILDQITDTKPPNDDQFVQSNPIRVEDNKQTDSTLPNTDQTINRYTTDTAYTSINDTPNIYATDSNTKITNSIINPSANQVTNSINSITQTNPATNSINSITQTYPINTIGSTIGSYSTNLITSESSNLNTISDQSNPNYDTYPNSQAITKTQLGRLQSTTPDSSPQDFQNSPQSNRFSPGGMNQQYSQNNMMGSMGSPSLISSIFSKFNQPMGTYYPYGNFGNGMYNYQNSYYPSYYGGSYGSGYPASMYNAGGGNFIQQAFYAKMRPIMSFFQRLTGKFNTPYSMYGGNYSPYGTYTNGLYNYGGDVYRNPLYKSNLFQKDVLTRKLDNVRNLGRNLLPNLQNSISSQNLNLQNSQPDSNLKAQIQQPKINSRQPTTNMQASGSDQFSSVHSSSFERRNAVEEDNSRNNLKAIAKLKGLDGKLYGEISFDQQQNQPDSVILNGELNNLSPGGHGLHIHEFGSLNSECTDYAIGPHYNPTQSQHGGLNTKIRHMGDLGNLFTDVNGVARISNLKTNLSLIGQNSILKKTIAVTENVDDLGEKDNEYSKLNGNSGKLFACGYIELVN